jgi:putative SOS response-associated peptidase YedK
MRRCCPKPSGESIAIALGGHDLLRRSQIEITGPASVTINAEANTVATIPAFADVFAGRRCIIPTSGFFLQREERRTLIAGTD